MIEHPAPVAFFTGLYNADLCCAAGPTPSTRAADAQRLAVKINAVLRKRASVAFPQRDLRLIGSPLSVRLVGGDEPGGDEPKE